MILLLGFLIYVSCQVQKCCELAVIHCTTEAICDVQLKIELTDTLGYRLTSRKINIACKYFIFLRALRLPFGADDWQKTEATLLSDYKIKSRICNVKYYCARYQVAH
jgi:hypothetical protein